MAACYAAQIMKDKQARGSSSTRSTDSEFVFAIQFRSLVREISVVKATPKGEFFAFTPYARVPNMVKGVTHRDAHPSVDIHMSKHRSGERHLTVKLGGKRHPLPESKVELQPTTTFSGVELLSHSPLLKGQFLDLPPLGTNRGKVVLLDTDSAGFRDDFLAVRVYLVEPGRDHEIPTPTDVGPCVRHIETSITPWVVVEVYQERMPVLGSPSRHA